MAPPVKKAKKTPTKGPKKKRSKALTTADEFDPSTVDGATSELHDTSTWNDIHGEGASLEMTEGEEAEVEEGNERETASSNPMTRKSSIEAPAPTPAAEEGIARPGDLEGALKLALEKLSGLSTVEFLQNLYRQADAHEQAVQSAKEIANDFVEKAADLAEAMQLLWQYDQLMLKKLNLTSVYDFGVKPKTDEETRAVMIRRAEKLVDLGKMQYDASHQISDSARPLVDYRFEACDDLNAVQDKISTMKAAEAALKEVELARKLMAEEQAKATAENEAEQEEGKGQDVA